LQVLEVRRPEDIEGAFAAVPQAGAGAPFASSYAGLSNGVSSSSRK